MEALVAARVACSMEKAIRRVLVVIWEASDRICGKRLRPLMPMLIEAMERHGHLDLAPEVRPGLLAMPEMLLCCELLPHLICSPPRFIVGGKHGAGQHGDA